MDIQQDEKPQSDTINSHASMILDNVVEGYWDWDIRTDRAFLSPGYCELLGYPPGTTFTSSLFLNSIHPEDLGGVSRVLREYLEGKRDSSVLEFRMARKDGTHIWLRERAKVVTCDENGKPAGMVGSVSDISTSKHIERELQASHELLRNLSEQVPGALFQSRLFPDGHFSTPYASRALIDIYGLTPKIVAKDATAVFETFHPEDRDDIFASIMESARTLQPWEYEYRVLLPTGRVKWLRGHACPVKLADGSILWHGIITDISERKAIERALAESEERYRRVFEVESDAIFLVSRSSGRFIDANKAATAIYGYRREELIGMDFTEVSAEPEQSRQFVESGNTYIPLRWHRRKDGTVFPVEISGSYFDYQGDSVHVAAIRDISERMKAERFREEAMELLEHQVQERTASLTVANEQLIREIEERKRTEVELLDHQQRLEALGLELSMAAERERGRIAGELHDQVGQCLILGKIKANSLAECDLLPEQRRIVAELERLLEMSIQDIRSLTFQLRPPILVTAGLEAAVEWLAEELNEHYSLTVDLQNDQQPKPLSSELRSCLFQAVRELLLNVAKHAGTDRARVTIERVGDTIAIAVADEGAGFEPAEAKVRTSCHGGFGLFNLQQRIQYLGGRFTMKSSPGKGSRATIIAPLTSFEEEPDRLCCDTADRKGSP